MKRVRWEVLCAGWVLGCHHPPPPLEPDREYGIQIRNDRSCVATRDRYDKLLAIASLPVHDEIVVIKRPSDTKRLANLKAGLAEPPSSAPELHSIETDLRTYLTTESSHISELLEAMGQHDADRYRAASGRYTRTAKQLPSISARFATACNAPLSTTARLAPKVIQAAVRDHYNEFRKCYEAGLARNPKLEGRVTVRFVILTDGSVGDATVERPASGDDKAAAEDDAFLERLGVPKMPDLSTTLDDAAVVQCVVDQYKVIRYPPPERGKVTVVYPIMFSPTTSPASSSDTPH